MKALCVSIAFLAILVGIEGCSKPSLVSTVANISPAVVRVITESATGSGMIIDKAGYVLTNSHVVEGSQSIKVVFADKREYPASMIGRDEIKDLAILKIMATNLPVVTLGNSEKLTPGDEVIAIGYPLDLTGSATISRGIVSALRKDTENGLTYIQTDASINPGSSGGALINLSGEVVGINVMIIRVAGGTPIEGINFAIAINSAKPIIPKLIAGESVLKPWATYTNRQYKYSILYPSTWEITESQEPELKGFFTIRSPGTASISLFIPSLAPDYTPSEHVDNVLRIRSSFQLVFRVLSREDLMWQGVYPACEWTSLSQFSKNSASTKTKALTLSRNGYQYQVWASANESEYDAYSSTFDTVIASFRLIE